MDAVNYEASPRGYEQSFGLLQYDGTHEGQYGNSVRVVTDSLETTAVVVGGT